MEKIATGIIRTSHGIHGYVKVKPYSTSADHFQTLEKVQLRSREKRETMYIDDVRVSSKELLIKFHGIDSREDARMLANREIWVDRSEGSSLDEDEFYFTDLIGCRVVHQGREVGVIRSIVQGAQTELLEVRTETGDYLIPFLKIFIGRVSIEQQSVELLEERLLQ